MRPRHVLLAIIAFVGTYACSEQPTGTFVDNEPPQVWLSAAPPEGSVTKYTVRLWWGGWDPDGQISHYEYTVTNNENGIFNPADTVTTDGNDPWDDVFSTDTTLVLTADALLDSNDIDDNLLEPEEFRRSHTFFIRAVDDTGLRSRTVYRTFTSRTLSPVVDIRIPTATGIEPAQVPPVTTFSWFAEDYVGNLLETQDPEWVRTILVPIRDHSNSYVQTLDYIRRNPNAPEWLDWRPYRTGDSEGKTWTSYPMDQGEGYVFAVQVKDEAGAVSAVFDLERNVRFLLAGIRSAGPILVVRNRYMGVVATSAENTPLTFLDLPPSVPLVFDWEASAQHYGGRVAGYRYGWDIQDLNDDESWETNGYVPFVGTVAYSRERTFFDGVHTFWIEVIDNNGFKSRAGITVSIVPFTFERNVLFVDDWQENSAGWEATQGGLPSDEEHDAFWARMLEDVDGFNPLVDMVNLESGREIHIEDIRAYKTIIWNAQGNHTGPAASVLARVIRFVDPTETTSSSVRTLPNLVTLFMAAGGRILLCGDRVMTMVINHDSFPQYISPVIPIIFRYELAGDQDGAYTGQFNNVGRHGVGEESPAYQDFCLNVLDVAINTTPNSIRRRRPPVNQTCGVDHLRKYTAVDEGMRGVSALDPAFPGFPLDDVAGGPGRWYERIGVNTDIYNPAYFAIEADCNRVAELFPKRACFEPIYGLVCNDQNSLVYGAPVAFWTSVWRDRGPEHLPPARSAVWGFHPVFFDEDLVKQALDVLLFEEWSLPHRGE